MDVVNLILLLLAAVCFGLAALSSYNGRRVVSENMNLVAAGLLFWVLVPLIDQIRNLN